MGKKETSLKYFKGSDWLKTSDKLCFNADAVTLAEQIPGKMDENNNFVVANRFEEHMLATTSTESQFQTMKGEMDTFLASQPSLFVQDGKLGSNERCGIHVRTVTNDPLTALILKSIMVGCFLSLSLTLCSSLSLKSIHPRNGRCETI